jgi:hypothetical protein
MFDNTDFDIFELVAVWVYLTTLVKKGQKAHLKKKMLGYTLWAQLRILVSNVFMVHHQIPWNLFQQMWKNYIFTIY